MDRKKLESYARLIVKTGINIQKDQILVVSAPVENYQMVELIAEIAYQEGAREVIPNWKNERLDRKRYLHGAEDLFDEIPEYKKMFYLENVRKDAGYVWLVGDDPDNLSGVDQDRIIRDNRTIGEALTEYRERLSANKNAWCVASAPTKVWAKKVYPNLTGEEAVEALWEAILKTNRIDVEDPVAAWEEHKRKLQNRREFLNGHRFKTLHYTNDKGTDLSIELPEKHLWLGGSDVMDNGVEIMANLPTEEVYTLPLKDGVRGIVYSTKPLVYNGVLIDEFWLKFEQGKVVDYKAEKGQEALKGLLDLDEGSPYLGEVALVPYRSPISQMNLLFYETLFDENASCHLALGEAYPVCLEGGDKMNKKELEAKGVNTSIAHEDFMVGSADLRIVGITTEGEEVLIMENGDFAFEQ